MSAPDYKLFTPSYPFVLVQAIPKSVETQSGIILTDSNKPLHEAIVLRTWEPWHRHITSSATDDKIRQLASIQTCDEVGDSIISACHGDKRCTICTAIVGARELLDSTTTVVEMVSEFKPGDRVLYPHYAKAVDPAHPDILFIREGHDIYGKVPVGDTTIRRDLDDMLKAFADTVAVNAGVYISVADLTEKLLNEFAIVPRSSISTSGSSTEGID